NKEVSVAQVHELGTLLYDHIRFEERELYPTVEKYLSEAELDAVYEASPDSIKRPDESR
ncbi:hemerythrin domain-containing protein, partial [Psychrobacter sp. Ps5]|nr:hemerythrin domain-containing protein [Psychrobacter sp. Ps5]